MASYKEIKIARHSRNYYDHELDEPTKEQIKRDLAKQLLDKVPMFHLERMFEFIEQDCYLFNMPHGKNYRAAISIPDRRVGKTNRRKF